MKQRELHQERYVSLTTFSKDGTPKPVPVWPVDAGDGRIGIVTSSKTWKVRRILNNPDVQLQPSNSRGQTIENSKLASGTARVAEHDDFQAINNKVKAKYGYQLKLINFMHALPGKRSGHKNDRAIIITLDEA